MPGMKQQLHSLPLKTLQYGASLCRTLHAIRAYLSLIADYPANERDYATSQAVGTHLLTCLRHQTESHRGL